jgi:tRNA-splicing endonuclease subunit Sen54
MEDKDEDAVRGTSVEPTQVETDLSDETQDFRLLSHLNLYARNADQGYPLQANANTHIRSSLTDTSSPGLPKRGEKDFEPNPTEHQADVLSKSRQAMHDALAHPRLHNLNSRVIAYYAPDGPAPPPGIDIEDPARFGYKGVGVNVHPDSCVYVPNPKGQYFKTTGQSDRWNRVWLLPEEALFLIERGSLDIRWPIEMTAAPDDESPEELSIPMSLQAAYACFMGRAGLTLERYTVYTGLKRTGYALARAPGWDDSAQVEGLKDQSQECASQRPLKRGAGLAGILEQLFSWAQDPLSTRSTAAGPVVGCGMHRSYSEFLLIPRCCFQPSPNKLRR